MAYKIHCVPILRDNYCWIIGTNLNNSVYILDPGESKPVLDYLKTHNLQPIAILLTHKHPDHIMGIDDIRSTYEIPVYGPGGTGYEDIKYKRGPGYLDIKTAWKGGENVELWPDHILQVAYTPGHTNNHLCFVIEDETKHLFCGDTLFSAGCGRLLGGSAEQLKASLDWIKSLPLTTKIYSSHEYTSANLMFAEAVEPNNTAIPLKVQQVEQFRRNQTPSLPSILSEELKINPFLRCDKSTVQDSVKRKFHLLDADDQEIFTHLRQWKDAF